MTEPVLFLDEGLEYYELPGGVLVYEHAISDRDLQLLCTWNLKFAPTDEISEELEDFVRWLLPEEGKEKLFLEASGTRSSHGWARDSKQCYKFKENHLQIRVVLWGEVEYNLTHGRVPHSIHARPGTVVVWRNPGAGGNWTVQPGGPITKESGYKRKKSGLEEFVLTVKNEDHKLN